MDHRVMHSAADAADATVARTERLVLRRLHDGDADFIFELVNDPDWLRNIGDKGVRNLDDAQGYIRKGPVDMYARLGFGLWCVELKSDGTRIGMCGLIKRDSLEDVDIGFAYLPAFRGAGYAREAAQATLAQARDTFGLRRVVAIVSPHNRDSAKLLGRVGFGFQRKLALSADDEVDLYAIEF